MYSVTALRRGGRRRRNEPSAQFASLIAPYAGCAGTCAVLSRSGPVQSLLSNYLDQILALPFTSSQARKDKPRRGSPGMFAGPDRLAFGHPLVRQGCHVGQVSAWSRSLRQRSPRPRRCGLPPMNRIRTADLLQVAHTQSLGSPGSRNHGSFRAAGRLRPPRLSGLYFVLIGCLGGDDRYS